MNTNETLLCEHCFGDHDGCSFETPRCAASVAARKREPTGYVHCAHKHCFAIVVGRPGDLCEDCKGDPDAREGCCAGCDNDATEAAR